MGRRYYCDYCNKTFIDELGARKKHLQSSHHIKLRNEHYEKYRDPAVIFKEEIVKSVCRRFEQNGTCQFLGNCKYTHYTQQELWHLKQQVDYQEYLKLKKKEDIKNSISVDSWIDQYNEGQHKCDNQLPFFWTYPEFLKNRSDIPPSLKKISDNFNDIDCSEEWGNSSDK